MEATINEIMELVDAHKDAQAQRRFGKLPLIRKAIEAKLSEALSKERPISQDGQQDVQVFSHMETRLIGGGVGGLHTVAVDTKGRIMPNGFQPNHHQACTTAAMNLPFPDMLYNCKGALHGRNRAPAARSSGAQAAECRRVQKDMGDCHR